VLWVKLTPIRPVLWIQIEEFPLLAALFGLFYDLAGIN